MSNWGRAYTLATLIYGWYPDKPLGEIAETIYQAVDNMDFGSNERKADLYAQLAEKLKHTTPFFTAVNIIDDAMSNTNRRYFGG